MHFYGAPKRKDMELFQQEDAPMKPIGKSPVK
jgi:hypothetical protein